MGRRVTGIYGDYEPPSFDEQMKKGASVEKGLAGSKKMYPDGEFDRQHSGRRPIHRVHGTTRGGVDQGNGDADEYDKEFLW